MRTPHMKHGVWKKLRKLLYSELENVIGGEEEMEEWYVVGFLI